MNQIMHEMKISENPPNSDHHVPILYTVAVGTSPYPENFLTLKLRIETIVYPIISRMCKIVIV